MAGASALHWTSVTGTAPTIETALARTAGGKAFRFTTSAATGRWQRDFTAGIRTAVMRVAIRFESLPNIDTTIAGWGITSGGVPMLKYRTATTDLVPSVGATDGSTGFTVTTGVWYVVDLKCDTSSGTRTCNAQVAVDGQPPTDLGAASVSVAAFDLANIRIGSGAAGETPTADILFDDFAHSVTLGDYPLGWGKVVGLRPRADGTHNASSNTDFQVNDTTNIATNATDTWQNLDDPLDNLTDFIAANGAASGEYLEWLMDAMPAVASINGVEVVSSHHSAGTAANKQTMRLIDGGSSSDVFTDADFSVTQLLINSKQYTTKPSSGAWTKTTLDAVKLRWGSSFGTVDIAPVPYIDAIVLEADYVPQTTGTVAATTAGLNGAGTATETIPGTAAATTAGLNAAATATQVVAVTGTVVAATAGLDAAATATEVFTGTAAATTAGLNAAATAAEVFTGTAAATTAGLNGAATATEVFTGTAAATTAGLNAAVTAIMHASGTADATVAGLNAAATAAEVFTGTAAATTAGLNASVTAVESIPGTVAATTAGLDAAATATAANPISASVAATTAGLNAAVTAEQETDENDALVTVTTAGLNAAVTATETITGPVFGELPSLSAAATATESIPATVAITVAGLSGSAAAVSAELIEAEAELTLAGLSASADLFSGFETTGTVALAFGGLEAAATMGQETGGGAEPARPNTITMPLEDYVKVQSWNRGLSGKPPRPRRGLSG